MLSTSTDGRHWSKPQQLYRRGPPRRHLRAADRRRPRRRRRRGLRPRRHRQEGQRRHAVRDRRAGDRGAVRPARLDREEGPRHPKLRQRGLPRHPLRRRPRPRRLRLLPAARRQERTRAATPRSPTAASTSTASRCAPTRPARAIVIDDAAHTIESVGGNASILLEHPGIPTIKLWDGPLKAALGKADNVGDPLFSMPMTTFHGDVLGFEALGTPVAVLGTESVSIPLSLKMPSYLGVTGSATLAANMAEGLQRPSLHIAIPDVVLTGVELRGGVDRLGRAGRPVDGDRRARNAARRRRRRARRPRRPDRLRPRRLLLRRLHHRPVSGHADLPQRLPGEPRRRPSTSTRRRASPATPRSARSPTAAASTRSRRPAPCRPPSAIPRR